MARIGTIVAAGALLAAGSASAYAAEPVMVRCGREYQAAKTAGTLAGADWSRYREDCAARLKGTPAPEAVAVPAAAPAAPAGPAAAVAPVAARAAPPSATAAPAPSSGGLAAMHDRQKACGAEWRAGKASLVAATPGLTWPRYWSQCNARLKSAQTR